MTTDTLILVRSILTDILRRDGPQPGARLKTQLGQSYLASAGHPFHERILGFAKFSQLLEAQADLLVVERPTAGPGDIIVRLRDSSNFLLRSDDALQNTVESGPQKAPRPTAKSTFGSLPDPHLRSGPNRTWRISKPLWSAFINPDPNRERYLHRPTSEVLTFSRVSMKPVDALLRQRFELLRNDCVQIEFIRFEEQAAWMEEYVRSHLPEEEREAVIADARRLTRWTAQTGFMNLLGFERADNWRQFRFERVIARIRAWLNANGLRESVMQTAFAPPEVRGQTSVAGPRGVQLPTDSTSASIAPRAVNSGRIGVRDFLHALIDTLPDDQLDRVLVPGSAVARLSSIIRSVRG